MREREADGEIGEEVSEVPHFVVDLFSYRDRYENDIKKKKDGDGRKKDITSVGKKITELCDERGGVGGSVSYGQKKRMGEDKNENVVTDPPMDLIKTIKTEKVLEPMDPADEDELDEEEKFGPKAEDPAEGDVNISAAGILDVVA